MITHNLDMVIFEYKQMGFSIRISINNNKKIQGAQKKGWLLLENML